MAGKINEGRQALVSGVESAPIGVSILLGLITLSACAPPPNELVDDSPRMVVSTGARPDWAKQARTTFHSPDRRFRYAVGWGKSEVQDSSLAIAEHQALTTAERVFRSAQGCRIKSHWEDQKDGTFYALAECPDH